MVIQFTYHSPRKRVAIRTHPTWRQEAESLLNKNGFTIKHLRKVQNRLAYKNPEEKLQNAFYEDMTADDHLQEDGFDIPSNIPEDFQGEQL